MITIRIHLDQANEKNGCLSLIPKSNELGILSQTDINQCVSQYCPVICEVPEGSALIMRPHILHSSSKAESPTQRRILHLEYSSYQLPEGVNWA